MAGDEPHSQRHGRQRNLGIAAQHALRGELGEQLFTIDDELADGVGRVYGDQLKLQVASGFVDVETSQHPHLHAVFQGERGFAGSFFYLVALPARDHCVYLGGRRTTLFVCFHEVQEDESSALMRVPVAYLAAHPDLRRKRVGDGSFETAQKLADAVGFLNGLCHRGVWLSQT